MDEVKSEPVPAAFGARLRAAIPILGWLPQYQPGWLGPDALAGLTLAAYAIPVSLAYASLAGLPPQVGVSGYLLGGVGYAIFGSSRHLAVGPTAGISLLVGSALAALSGGDMARQAALASMCALLVALLFGLAWLLRLSVVANFISDSILTGFKAGAALLIASTQLPTLFGVKGGGVNFFERLWLVGQQLGDAHLFTLGLGAGALALLLAGEKHWPGRPVALGVVMVSLLAVSGLGLTDRGLKVVGAFSADLRIISLGSIDLAHYREILRLAFACFVVAYVESISAARTFALKHRYEVDARQELLGLGAANLLAGLGQGYPLAGGLSQSAVNEKAGARSSLSLLFASVVLGLVLMFLTGVFRNLPQAVLAAVVLVAVKGLFDVEALGHLWRVSRFEFTVAAVALGGVLLLGILDGVILATIASLLLLLSRAAAPHVAFLGRIPGTNRFSDLARHPDNEPIPGVLAFRVEAPLLYFNEEHVLRTVLERVRLQSGGLTLVACDLSNSPYVDLAGARMLARLHDELQGLAINLRVVEAHAEERDILRAEGLEKLVGPIDRRMSLADLLDDLDPTDSEKTDVQSTQDW